jgi:protein-disulfide isomerase
MRLVTKIFLLAAFLTITTTASFAETKSNFSDAQRGEITSMIRQFIVDNPQALIASVESHYNKQQDEAKKQEGKLEEVPAGLYDSPMTPSVGPADAKFSVVYFFDYNCGFCKQVDSDLNRVIGEEKNIKFLFKELPILNESSELASRWALAANKQGKYLEFHSGLMQRQGAIDESVLESVAKEKGLDVAQLKIDANSAEITDAFQKNIDLARSIGVRGTPFFIIGKEKVPGAIGYSKMKEVIARERDGVTPAAQAAAVEQMATPPAAPAPGEVDPEIQKEIDALRADVKKEIKEIVKESDKK